MRIWTAGVSAWSWSNARREMRRLTGSSPTYRDSTAETATVVIQRSTGVFGITVPAEVIVDGNSLAAQLRRGKK